MAGFGKKPIRVLVVDDSAIIRKMMTQLLSADPEIEVVGVAPDPFIARDKLVKLKPDVMTLDIEMPRMDGISFLRKVMQHFPVRTLIVSSLSKKNSEIALSAFEAGAIDVFQKPALDVDRGIQQMRDELTKRVKTVSRSALRPLKKSLPGVKNKTPRFKALDKTTHQIICIASSTGGTEALKEVLANMPPDIPGTLVVQHMPPVFTKSYAASLNKICPFHVKEAQEGDKVIPGQVLLAPGNFHMELKRSGAFYYVSLNQGPMVQSVRPAADVLMKSAAHIAGKNAVGVVLTGMGKDGAEGLLAMKEAGSFNIAQNEQTCVVFGMPKEAIDCGAIDKVLPLEKIAPELVQVLQKMEIRKAS